MQPYGKSMDKAVCTLYGAMNLSDLCNFCHQFGFCGASWQSLLQLGIETHYVDKASCYVIVNVLAV